MKTFNTPEEKEAYIKKAAKLCDKPRSKLTAADYAILNELTESMALLKEVLDR